MSFTISDDDDDQFLSKLDLDEISVLDENVKCETSDSKKWNKPVSANTTVTSSTTCGEFDEDDDDILFLGDFGNDGGDSRPVGGTCSSFEEMPPPPVPGRLLESNRLEPGKRREGKVVFVKREEDDEWKGFLRWFGKQQAFEKVWFQAIPVTELNFRVGRSIVEGFKDWGHLVQFSRLLVSFLREMSGSEDLHGDSKYFKDMLNLLQTLLVRFEKELVNNSSHRGDVDKICEDILQAYVLGEINFTRTRIPELLVNVYPKAFQDIMCQVVKTGNINMLLPICIQSRPNFLKIIKSLQSEEAYSNAGIHKDDPDFKAHSNPPLKLATNLLNLLQEKAGPSYLRVIPTQLQPLFSFDSVVSGNVDDLSSNEAIVDQLYCLLNDLFCECATDSQFEQRECFTFLLSNLPFCSKILNDKKLERRVKFRTYPYLWMHVKKLGRL